MSLANPPDGIYHFEDIEIGTAPYVGQWRVTRKDIVEFAQQFDPQPIHLDDEAAKRSVVQGLCASGLHTSAIMMRLLCDHVLLRSTSLGSPGIEHLQWHKPVRPDDTLQLTTEVHSKRVLASKPDVGIADITFGLVDINGEKVLSARGGQFMRLRHPASRDAKSLSPQDPGGAETRSASSTTNARTDLWSEPDNHISAATANHFEDVAVGDLRDLGTHTFDRDGIMAFARAWDPQPFHLDEDAGRRSLFGGLSASGWHTASIFIRKVVDTRAAHQRAVMSAGNPLAAWGPSPGFKNLQWPKPVLAGDTVTFRQKVTEKVELKSRPERGLVITHSEGRNQRGDVVLRFTGQMFVERRAPARIG